MRAVPHRLLHVLAGLLWLCPALGCAQESQATSSDRFAALILAAEQAAARGHREEAVRLARQLTSQYERGGATSVAEHTSAGRAYVLQGVGNVQAVKAALAAFDRATAMDSSYLESQRRTAALFLDKYDAPEARTLYAGVLRRAPDDAEALLGLARVEEFESKGNALETARKSANANPRFAPARAFIARLHLDAESFDSARATARSAVALDSTLLDAWSVLGAVAWLTGDSASYRETQATARRLQPGGAEFDVFLAEAAVRQRRYADAVRLAGEAVRRDSLSVSALGVLGTNLLRLGDFAGGRVALERAFALDPYNVWHKNTLDLLDKMRGFRTVERGRFRITAPEKEADLLVLYIAPLLERAYDSLALRYDYRPATPIHLELYDVQADFSVRTVGLNGLGALGVSFGNLLALDAPNVQAKGSYNWGSTAWHELAHTFTLGASAHRVPRWLSEGLSVLEERRANPGWGARGSLGWLMAYAGGRIRPLSQLNDGFMRPRSPDEVGNSYYQASLFGEWVETTRGVAALRDLLKGYRDGQDTPAVFQRVLGLSMAQADAQFDTWVQARYASAIAAVGGMQAAGATGSARDSSGGNFVRTMREALTLLNARPDSARVLFERARGMMPAYAGDDGPSWFLSQLALQRGDTAAVLTYLPEVTGRDETAYDANVLEARVRGRRGDVAGAMAAWERALWIWPYETADRRELAQLAAQAGDHPRAVRERRAVLALRPTDVLQARYELAKALADGGDVAGARRELLTVLEEAPSYEQAQALLLELRGRGEPR
jgi:tetratricopeptide (TPR) repeat protein